MTPPPEPSTIQQLYDALRASLDVQRDIAAVGPWPVAAGFVVVGILFLLWGFRLYRFGAILCGVAYGAAAGFLVATWLSVNEVACVIAGAAILGLLAWPLVKAVWALMCGVILAWVGGLAVWFFTPASGEVAWVAATAAGFVVGVALGFAVFRFATIFSASLSGGMMLVLGVLRLTAFVPSIGDPVMKALVGVPWLFWALPIVPAVFGLIFQLGDPQTLPGSKRPKKKKSEEED